MKTFFTDQWCWAGRGRQIGRRQRGRPSSRGGERKRQLCLLGAPVRVQRHQHHGDGATYPAHTRRPGQDTAGNACRRHLFEVTEKIHPLVCRPKILCAKHSPLISAFSGSPEPDGFDQHRHPSEGRPQHPAARERLQRRDAPEAAGPNAQHSSQHSVQVTAPSGWDRSHCVTKQGVL